MNFLFTLIQAAFGMALVVGVWFVLQAVNKEQDGGPGCAGCQRACSRKEHHHESA